MAAAFLERLEREVLPSREKFFATRLFRGMSTGTCPVGAYKGYLQETYHFVRHTPRFLAVAAARFGYGYEAIRRRFLKHTTEEFGHELFALKDLETLGGDPEQAKKAEPLISTTALVAFHYYWADRVNPVGLFGTIYTLEGLGQGVASGVAEALVKGLKIPKTAVTFLSSHGEFDQKHMAEARQMVEKHVKEEQDERDIVYCSRAAFELYTWMFDQIYDRYLAEAKVKETVPV